MESDLKQVLDGSGSFTMFAPTDDAFNNIPKGDLDNLLKNKVELTNILQFHMVEKKILSSDLECKQLIEMSNGKDCRTVCSGTKMFVKGTGNSDDQSPEIIATDIPACNGVIHVVNEVLLPPPQPWECSNIVEIACNTQGFETLCAAIEAAGLDNELDGPDTFTVFAPTNDAFLRLPDGLPENTLALTNILKFHVAAGLIHSSDLECTELLQMSNGNDSRTVCQEYMKFQKGGKNSDDQMPEIVNAEIKACNGIIHVVSEVMLPAPISDYEVELPTPTSQCSNIVEIACGTESFSTLCSAIKAAGLDNVLDGPDIFTVFAPTNGAFDALPAGTLDSLLADKSALTNILAYHVAPGKLSSSDLACPEDLRMSNGNDSRTVCSEYMKFQKGSRNSDDRMPEIVTADIGACNGVIHVINEVLLPPPSSSTATEQDISTEEDIASTEEEEIASTEEEIASTEEDYQDGTQPFESKPVSKIEAISPQSGGLRSQWCPFTAALAVPTLMTLQFLREH
ncbi:hypothetical protein ACA910_012306 [Epithemia clementina (nom. ined.)]